MLSVYPSFSYTEALCKSGLGRLDNNCDLNTNIFKEIEGPKHPLHCSLRPVKVSDSQIVLQPTYPYQLLIMDEISVKF